MTHDVFICIYIYVCVYIYMSIYIYMYVYVYIYIYMSIYIYVCVYIYVYIYIYVYMYICIYVYMYICIYVYMYICIYVYMYICIYVYMYICNCNELYMYSTYYQISRAPGILGFLGNIGYQAHDATFGAVYAHKGCTKKLQHHGLHGFALDQPSINGIGPFHRSETVGNGRKRSET